MSLELASTSSAPKRYLPRVPLAVQGREWNVVYIWQEPLMDFMDLVIQFECGYHDPNQVHAIFVLEDFFARNERKDWWSIMGNLEFHSLIWHHRQSILGDAWELRVWLSNIVSSRWFDLGKATNDILWLISWRHAPFAANDEHYSESESGPDRWYEELICLYVRVVGTICDTTTRVPALCRGISGRVKHVIDSL